MYVGRFIGMIDLEEIFVQSLFGKNIPRHQPFDYCDDGSLSMEDPQSIKDQTIQNLLAHWLPKFIVDSMNELIIDDHDNKLGCSKVHTLTCKEQNNVIAPTIARHLENYHGMNHRPTDDHGQNSFIQYRHLIEKEVQHDDLRYFLAIYKPQLDKDYFDKFESYFKLALQTSPSIIKERIDRASKYPNQNMALKYARKKTNKK